MFACVYERMCVYARVRVSLYDSMRAIMPVCMRLWVCMYACERVLFMRLWVACVCVCIKIEAYIDKIPTVPNFSGLMLFRSSLLT